MDILLLLGCLDVTFLCASVAVEIWRSIATGQRWWLLPRRSAMVSNVVVIFGEQSLIIHCR